MTVAGQSPPPERVAEDELLEDRASKRSLARMVGPFVVGVVVTLVVLFVLAFMLRAPLMSFGAARLIGHMLEPYATESQQDAILDEFGRVAEWHAQGRIDSSLLFRAMQVTMDSPVVAHAAAENLSDALISWPGVDADRAKRVALDYGTMIYGGAGNHADLRDLLGGLASDDPKAGAFFYGETTIIPDGDSISEQDAAARLDRFEALVKERAPELTSIGPDLRAWLRTKLDAEVGWAINRGKGP